MDYPYGSSYSVAPSSTPPSYPTSLSSITTTNVLTESTTVTSYTTSTLSPYPPKDIVSAIEGLAECSVSLCLFFHSYCIVSNYETPANHPLREPRKQQMQPRRLCLHLHRSQNTHYRS
jgi:hypothetical protein